MVFRRFLPGLQPHGLLPATSQVQRHRAVRLCAAPLWPGGALQGGPGAVYAAGLSPGRVQGTGTSTGWGRLGWVGWGLGWDGVGGGATNYM